MSSTRRSNPEAVFRQEKFASSPEYDRGLKANLVADRCGLLPPEDREIVWWLQAMSHREGGLDAVAAELRASHPEAHLTALMREYLAAPASFDFEAAFKIRCEIEKGFGGFTDGRRRLEREAESRPEVATLEWLIERNRRNGANELTRRLETVCLDPSTRLSDTSPRYFSGLRSALVSMMKKRTTAIRNSSVTTEIGTKIRSAFEFTRRTRSLVIVQGEARMGKTFAARAWCEENLSNARFAQVPSTGDEIGFYRAIAKSLGVSINLNSKAQELRNRIEEVLQTGHLLLCLDEAHYLWPQTNYRDAHPQRINWLMTALINHGVPVVLVVTPQFFRHQQRIEHRTCWTSEQFTGRVSRFIDLPKSLPRADLIAVARRCLPGIGEDYIRALAGLAASSAKYLGAIDATVKAARFFAEEDGRMEPSDEDVARAIAESTIPSDTALTTALQEGLPTDRRRRRAAPAQQGLGSAPATEAPSGRRGPAVPAQEAEGNRLSTRSEPVRIPDPFAI